MAAKESSSPSPCPECGAANASGERFCAGCGLVLPRRRPPAETPARAAPEPPRRLRNREDSRYVGRSQTTLTAVRALYGVLAFTSALVTLPTWGAYVDEPEPTLGALLAVALLTSTTLITIAGFVFFAANPFVWTLTLAAMQTLTLALQVATIEAWSGMAIAVVAIPGALVVGLWCAVPITARVTKILRERTAAKDGARDAPLATRAAAREMQSQAQAVRTFGISAGAAVALALFAAWLPYRSAAAGRAAAELRAREQVVAHDRLAKELERTTAEFRAVWARSDLDKVKSYLQPDMQVTFWPKLLQLLNKRGWRETLPALGATDVSASGDDSFDVFFAIDDVERLKTRWQVTDGVWRMSRFMFSKY